MTYTTSSYHPPPKEAKKRKRKFLVNLQSPNLLQLKIMHAQRGTFLIGGPSLGKHLGQREVFGISGAKPTQTMVHLSLE